MGDKGGKGGKDDRGGKDGRGGEDDRGCEDETSGGEDTHPTNSKLDRDVDRPSKSPICLFWRIWYSTVSPSSGIVMAMFSIYKTLLGTIRR